MKNEYSDIVFEMSQTLSQVLLERESDLGQKVHELDAEVNRILRRIGFLVVSLVLLELANQVTLEASPGVGQMVVQLDGSHVRTSKKVMLEGVELTQKRWLPKCQRQVDWREVRVEASDWLNKLWRYWLQLNS